MPQRSLRLNDELLERITRAANSRGFSSVTAFIRASMIDAANGKDFGQELKGVEESLVRDTRASFGSITGIK